MAMATDSSAKGLANDLVAARGDDGSGGGRATTTDPSTARGSAVTAGDGGIGANGGLQGDGEAGHTQGGETAVHRGDHGRGRGGISGNGASVAPR